MSFLRTLALLSALAPLACLTGCGGGDKPAADAPAADGAEDGHGGHTHSHDGGAHGANGGELIEFDSKGTFHAEWLADDKTGVTTIHILGSDVSKVHPIAAESVKLEVVLADKEESKTLEAVGATGEPAMASEFALKDPALVQMVKMAAKGGAKVTLVAEIDGEVRRGVIEKMDHAEHH